MSGETKHIKTNSERCSTDYTHEYTTSHIQATQNSVRIEMSTRAFCLFPQCISVILAISCFDGKSFYRQTETQMAWSPLGDGL